VGLFFSAQVGSHLVDPREAGMTGRIERVAAPRPILGLNDEAAFHGSEVHVAELLDLFLVTPDIEIVKAALPELG
jgi:hypothetical protein